MNSETSNLLRRDEAVCGGNSNLTQCVGNFPSDFCCPVSTTCLQLDTAALAVLCCPAGQDCRYVQPIICNQSAQNATQNPSNQLHSDPTMELQTCGNGCCPMGAECQAGMCVVHTLAASSTSSTSTTAVASSTSAAETFAASTSSIISSSSSSTTSIWSSAPTALAGSPADPTTADPAQSNFSGAAFAAGFIPGIVIGAFVVALLLWCLKRRRGDHDSYLNEKHLSGDDQLTDLSTISGYRPTMHSRSISEPIANPDSHRTDFVRGSPPRLPDPALTFTNPNYTVTAEGPTTPARTPKIRALFSRSPMFPTAASPRTPPTDPLPSHLKRGTLSYGYTISPIRALRTKKSSHSLRRQMASAANATTTSRSSSRRNPRPSQISRAGSTETIQVLMPSHEPYTLDQRHQQPQDAPPTTLSAARYAPPTSSTWQTTPSITSSPAPPARTQRQQPSYAPSSFYSPYPPGDLGTPYTPTRYYGAGGSGNIGTNGNMGKGKATGVVLGGDGGLRVERAGDDRRQTTFSGLMEKAGIRPGEFLGPPGGAGRRV